MYLDFYDADVELTPDEEKNIYSDYSKVMRSLDMPMEDQEFDQASVVSHYLYFIDSFGKPSPVTSDVLNRVKFRKAVLS